MVFRQSLFWDTDSTKLDLEKNSKYIIERVLDYGRDEEVKWLWKTYNKSLLKDVTDNSRTLRKRTKALWTLILK
jgi:hypothetical protein